MPDDWPTHTQELSRKLSDLLGTIAWKLEHGKMSPKAAFIAVDTALDLCQGLADHEVIELTNQTRLALRREISKS
ncbi:hypothetical protein F1188_16105 [Roseospira marina]|uniref:Uncharacterized protein n=1 Tax=Roseospira marina TaxID=140057 RepID=A0A5M6I883_9PROT|nr:hypothetical protein [Roseospira marina]KAA5604383.1 hypothetical protein F1188_16105 [Roseospira marina]MBB4315428.1 hypothetical protein [Roseospira marina]MBB5088426.1 hypothetical protein [Roseospira marina]